jgi:hypothetical protein
MHNHEVILFIFISNIIEFNWFYRYFAISFVFLLNQQTCKNAMEDLLLIALQRGLIH